MKNYSVVLIEKQHYRNRGLPSSKIDKYDYVTDIF